MISQQRAPKWVGGPNIGKLGRFQGYKLGVGVWLGIHFDLWRVHGRSPLWAVFGLGGWIRAAEMASTLKAWAQRDGIYTAFHQRDGFAVPIEIPLGAEKSVLIEHVVSQLETIYIQLKILPVSEGSDFETPEKLSEIEGESSSQ